MSPLEIEFFRGVEFRVNGKELKEEPAVKIDKSGKEKPIKPGEFIPLSEKERVIIPDVPGVVMAKARGSDFAISKQTRDRNGNNPETDQVYIKVELEGYGFPRGGNEPHIEDIYSARAQSLKENPVPIYYGGEKVAEVSWREEKG